VALDVLQTKAEILRSRARLEQRSLSCLGMQVGKRTLWDRLRGVHPLHLGDELKSWDVLRTAEFVEREFPNTARVLDIGSYSSEILCVLHRLGFVNLTGIDQNPNLRAMPYGDTIHWEIGNFLRTPFPDRSFDVVTSISVIEHGFDAAALLGEMSRLLDHGGCFTASFDYWPHKLDTSDTQFFGMDWRIFSRDEVNALVTAANDYGLAPVGDLAFDALEPAVHYAGRDYTFAWLVLRKR